jgi:hypothetical protein
LDNATQGTSFAINGLSTQEDHTCGSTYLAFRNNYYIHGGKPDIAFQALGNSYYFYFGALPNGTAISKLNSKYFTSCERLNTNDFIISSTVINTSANGTSDGQIQFTVLGGTGPFTYTVTNNTTVTIGPIQTSTFPVLLNNLPSGTYTITVTDSLQTTVIKDIEITGPPSLVCSVTTRENACEPSSMDGIMSLTIAQGIGPYQASYLNVTTGVNVTIPNPQSGTQDITNLGVGDYVFTVSDSSSPQQVATSTATISSPPPLILTIDNRPIGYQDVSCGESNNAFIVPRVVGGIAPYMITVTRAANQYDGDYSVGPIDYLNTNFIDLYAGDYTITATDSAVGICQQTATKTLTLYKALPPTLTAVPNTKQCDPTSYTISFIANQAVSQSNLESGTPPPFEVFISIDGGNEQPYGQANEGLNTINITSAIAQSLEITIEDTNGCRANLQLDESTFRRPNAALNLSPSSRSAGPLPGYGAGSGLITWQASGDLTWPAFLPWVYQPTDDPITQFSNTYSALTATLVLGTVTNGVGCSATIYR